MKKFVRFLLILLLCFAAVFVGLLSWLSIADYKPEPVLGLDISGAADRAKPKSGEKISVLSWNIGYAGLGADSDFFMDGGKDVKSADKKTFEKYLGGIKAGLERLDADIAVLQEVDTDSSRTYGTDEAAFLGSGNYVHALNYSCPFVPFPLPPIGKVHSGILTVTGFPISSADRIALPSPFKWPVSTANLKRCLLVSRIPVEGSENELVIVNLHLEAYDDGEGKLAQTKMLRDFIENEYKKGNYVIAGGDFNQTFPGSMQVFPIVQNDYWVPGVLDGSFLPDGWEFTYSTAVPTCRLLNKPYAAGEPSNQHYVIDGFIISPNLKVESVENIDLGFENSDHNPVMVTVYLP